LPGEALQMTASAYFGILKLRLPETHLHLHCPSHILPEYEASIKIIKYQEASWNIYADACYGNHEIYWIIYPHAIRMDL